MDADSAPSDGPPTPPALGLLRWLRPFCEASAAGLLLGLADILDSGESRWLGNSRWIIFAYLIVGAGLGLRHAGRAWPCWVPLGASMYLVHVAAIACGRESPYVEENYQAVRQTLFFFFPAGAGLALGSSFRLCMIVVEWFLRKNGPPLRRLPRTTKGLLATVAGIAIALGWMRWIAFESQTIYAPGYRKGQFQRISVGMKVEQVEARLGQPLSKMNRSGDGTQEWRYTEQASSTSDYERRWIFIKDGQVQGVVSDYWLD